MVLWCAEKGERKRKSFSGTTKVEVTKKMADYVVASSVNPVAGKLFPL